MHANETEFVVSSKMDARRVRGHVRAEHAAHGVSGSLETGASCPFIPRSLRLQAESLPHRPRGMSAVAPQVGASAVHALTDVRAPRVHDRPRRRTGAVLNPLGPSASRLH
jgi:hypothetical protein